MRPRILGSLLSRLVRSLHTDVGYHQPNSHGRNLVMSVLNSTVTKREAKDYLNKYADESSLHYCLVFLKHLSDYSDPIVESFTRTIVRIQNLGLRPILVLDPKCRDISYQSQRLDNILHQLSLNSIIVSDPITIDSQGVSEVNIPVLSPHIIPIIEPYQYHEKKALKLLTKDPSQFLSSIVKKLTVNIDKIFLISKYGGLPSAERDTNSHVFVNLSQEYTELKRNYEKQFENFKVLDKDLDEKTLVQSLELHLNKNKILSDNDQLLSHMEDLEIMNNTLSVLPHSSTGLITTLNAASKHSDNNPLVYNILTDRSLISSSLPRFKRTNTDISRSWYELPPSTGDEEIVTTKNDSILVTTVLKKGIDVQILDYRTLTPENSIGLPDSLVNSEVKTDQIEIGPKVNLLKLKEIIDLSFKRSLDLEHYLKRINGNIASIIVIGDYDGIAILTYEGPKGNKFVYLDKFGVTPKLKGSLGISDIIFNLMFRKYPKELIWRSRSNNVVNKWYFQRSTGVLPLSLKLESGDQKENIFKLFYYGSPDIESFHNLERLRCYAKYVRDIKPSWHK